MISIADFSTYMCTFRQCSDSHVLSLIFTASGLRFTATPDRAVVGDSANSLMVCSAAENGVQRVNNMRIKRTLITPGSTTDELIAPFFSKTATLDDGITNDKGFSVTGALNGASSQLELAVGRDDVF